MLYKLLSSPELFIRLDVRAFKINKRWGKVYFLGHDVNVQSCCFPPILWRTVAISLWLCFYAYSSFPGNNLLPHKFTLCSYLCCSSVIEEQQAHSHNHPEPSRARYRWRCRMHRLHPPDTVHWWTGPPSYLPVWGDPRLAPPWWQVAKRPLPLLGSTSGTTPVKVS